MNKLSIQARAQMLNMLCEGASMRAVSRFADVSINTVAKLLIDAGTFCPNFHDDNVRGVTAKRVQCDEIWSFTAAKQKNVAAMKVPVVGAGDTWTWTGIDADTKLIVSWLVGERDGEYAMAFMDDLRSRLANRVQLTTDGHKAYLQAVEGAFGGDVDYAVLHKVYGNSPESFKGKYSPAECIGTQKRRIEGEPEMKHVSTSFIERSNLTMRMHNRRFTRLTNAFSKKFESHVHMVAIWTVWYNWVRIHKSLRITPAMAANLTTTVWSWETIVAKMDEIAPKAGRPKTYKKRDEQISN
ncbi:MAG: IS1 family transposase [Aestuariivirga sp.]